MADNALARVVGPFRRFTRHPIGGPKRGNAGHQLRAFCFSACHSLDSVSRNMRCAFLDFSAIFVDDAEKLRAFVRFVDVFMCS